MKSKTNREAVIREKDLDQLKMLTELRAKADSMREAADSMFLNVMDYDSLYEDDELADWAKTLETINDGYDLLSHKINRRAIDLCWTDTDCESEARGQNAASRAIALEDEGADDFGFEDDCEGEDKCAAPIRSDELTEIRGQLANLSEAFHSQVEAMTTIEALLEEIRKKGFKGNGGEKA